MLAPSLSSLRILFLSNFLVITSIKYSFGISFSSITSTAPADCDTLIGLNRPAKQKIRFYGPDRYIIKDDKTLVLHFLKARNGDARMSFFKAAFERMEILEMDTPPQQQRRH